MPGRVEVSVVVKRMIQLEYERPLFGSHPGDIVLSFRTINYLCSERPLVRRPCLLSLESLHEQSATSFDRELIIHSRCSAPSRYMTTKILTSPKEPGPDHWPGPKRTFS
jgi:hypothetical protein